MVVGEAVAVAVMVGVDVTAGAVAGATDAEAFGGGELVGFAAPVDPAAVCAVIATETSAMKASVPRIFFMVPPVMRIPRQ
ncbi:MAG TPA: hypothetical protein VMV83_11930 [Rectinemataceae bacterium]|nr:hypothetical protein [Rectinemataceae bacterium]